MLFRYGFDAQRKNRFRVMEFERKFAEYAGSKHALAVSSGSAALQTALRALGIGPGDEVITQAFTFVASAEAVIETGAVPVICEIDGSLNMCPEDLERKITPRTKCVMPVHMLGAPADLDAIISTAERHGLPVLEDSCQACGSSYRGRKTGTVGLAGCYSFDYVKTITTGEGGMLVTNDDDLYRKASEYHDHGHEHRGDVPRGMDTRTAAGFNFRMSELSGALGLVQLSRLDYVISRQRENKAFLKSLLDRGKVEFRLQHDEEGDGGDTLIFFTESPARASRVEKSLSERGFPTKILPSALDWHFAGRWTHMRKFLEPADEAWDRTGELLGRAVALPVPVIAESGTLEKMAGAAGMVL